MKKLNSTGRFLSAHLERKKKNYTAFSMRAMARQLKLSPTYVDHILKDKKPLPVERLRRFAKVLDLDEAATQELKQLLGREFLDKHGLPPMAPTRTAGLSSYEPQARTTVTALSPWYMPALLDLSTCDDFEDSPRVIARRLGITENQATEGLKHLCSMGLMESDGNRLRKSQDRIRFNSTQSVHEIRQYHKEMLTKAREHLLQATTQKDFDARLISGVTTAVNPAKIEEARKRFNEAMHEIVDILTDGPCTEVYQVNVQLFPLSKKEK